MRTIFASQGSPFVSGRCARKHEQGYVLMANAIHLHDTHNPYLNGLTGLNIE